MFLSYKYLYSNSVIYNFTYKGLASKLCKSRNTIKSHIKSFLSLGWCELINGNLSFLSQKKILEKNEYKFTSSGDSIESSLDKKSILQRLQKLILLNKKRSCLYSNMKQHRLVSTRKRLRSLAGSETKSAKSVKFIYNDINDFNNKQNSNKFDDSDHSFNISYKGLSELFGCSKSSAFRFIKELEESKEIKKSRRISRINGSFDELSIKSMQDTFGKHFYIDSRGRMNVSLPNAYSVL